MRFILSIWLGFVLDLLIGDPPWIPHPVVFMGKCIAGLEKLLRNVFPKTPEGERIAGIIPAILLPAGTFCVSTAALWGCRKIHPWLEFALNTFWCFQALAVHDMIRESRNVAHEVSVAEAAEAASYVVGQNPRKRAKKKKKIWESSRRAVGRIVGRDTDTLDQAGIIRATVETIAENFSDGVVAPLIYMMIGGAPFALTYKSINTMDSMVGYKNEKYLYFGRAAARLDDVANFIPSRFAALIMILSSRICEGKKAARKAFLVWRRDRRKHSSPNSAQTESVMAGALGVRLLGPARYFGTLHDKEWIGDDTREIETKDIDRACRIFLLGSVLVLLILSAMRVVCVHAVPFVLRKLF